MPRRTKYNEEKADAICNRLKAGWTRKASYESANISHETFRAWLLRFPAFLAAVTRAESEIEGRLTTTIVQAAAPHEVQTIQRTTKTVYKTRKSKLKDGTVIEEPIALEDVSETVTTVREFDWRAALEWLKRRRHKTWGDRKQIDIANLTTEQIIALLEEDAEGGTGEAGEGGDEED